VENNERNSSPCKETRPIFLKGGFPAGEKKEVEVSKRRSHKKPETGKKSALETFVRETQEKVPLETPRNWATFTGRQRSVTAEKGGGCVLIMPWEGGEEIARRRGVVCRKNDGVAEQGGLGPEPSFTNRKRGVGRSK